MTFRPIYSNISNNMIILLFSLYSELIRSSCDCIGQKRIDTTHIDIQQNKSTSKTLESVDTKLIRINPIESLIWLKYVFYVDPNSDTQWSICFFFFGRLFGKVISLFQIGLFSRRRRVYWSVERSTFEIFRPNRRHWLINRTLTRSNVSSSSFWADPMTLVPSS